MKSDYSINVNGRLMDLSTPQVMGILNVTPDSFYAASRMQTEDAIDARARQIMEEGASIIDIGAYSSRPGAEHISAREEMDRLERGLTIILKRYPEAVISVDTFRAEVAEQCVRNFNVAIINDISAGEMDDRMFDTVAKLNVPYIMMHMKGTPQNMSQQTQYDDFWNELFLYFSRKINVLHAAGVKDIILDPGFGFGKTLDQNYQLMAHMEEFKEFDMPVLVGISRKSMIYNLLGGSPAEALNGTTVLNTIALDKGASILRVHDVRACVEVVKIHEKLKSCKP